MTPKPLYPYQTEAVHWLAPRINALLALEMGLGKTAVSIRAAELCHSRSILVICPAIAVSNWNNEFKTWAIDGTRDFKAISYGSLHKLPVAQTYDTLILDECHFLKSPDALRTRTIFGRTGLLRRVKRVWCLSGTPAPNHAGELWVMLYVFGYTRLKYQEFIERFCEIKKVRIGKSVFRNQIFGTKIEHIPILKSKLEFFMLRKRKTDPDVNLQLPPINYSYVYIDREKEFNFDRTSFVHFHSPYDKREQFFKEMERERDLLTTLFSRTSYGKDAVATMQTISNSVSTFRRYLGVQKITGAVKLIEEELKAKLYEKIVVFAVHRDVIFEIAERLRKFKAVSLYGGTAEKMREKNLAKFRNEKSCNVLCANIQAAGTAINLTHANQVLFVEQDWCPGNNAQAAMRCHRIGQTRPVTVRVALTDDVLDQRINFSLKKKMAELTQIFDTVHPPENSANLREEILKAKFDSLCQ